MKQEAMETEYATQQLTLATDPNYFKILLPSLDLFVLQSILKNLAGTTIREVYSEAISSLFVRIFDKEETKSPEIRRLKRQSQKLILAGYPIIIIENQLCKNIMKSVYTTQQILSETDLTHSKINYLKQFRRKFPSYDKIKGIFQKFENMNIITKKEIVGKKILYVITPHFYKTFKDKLSQIKEL